MHGFGLLTLSLQRNSKEVIQNEGMWLILGCTRDTSAEAIRYLLNLPPMPDRHKLAQVKAFGQISADPGILLYAKIVKQQNAVWKEARHG